MPARAPSKCTARTSFAPTGGVIVAKCLAALRGLDGQEIPARACVGGTARRPPSGSSSRRCADAIDAIGQLLRELRAHLATLEHVLDLRDELSDQSAPPRRPGRRARRLRVGLGQEVERGQALRGTDRRGDVEDEVLVGEVSTRGRVGEQEVLGDHEADEIAERRVGAHPIEDRPDDPRADRHVATLAVLPDVVQEGAQEEGIGIGDLLHRLGLDRIVGGAVTREALRHRAEGARQVRVHREPVIRVTLRAAAHVGPFRDEPGEHAEAVEDLERQRSSIPRPEQTQEGPSHVRIPCDLRRDVELVDRIEERRRRLPAGFRLVRERIQHAGGRRRRRRRPDVPSPRRRSTTARRMNSTSSRVLEQGPHEPVDRDQLRLVLEPHGRGDGGLVIEHQPVGPFPGLEVEGAPGASQELLRARERLALAGAEESGVLEPPPTAALDQPDRMQVTPPAGALLQVGLQQVRGGAESLGSSRRRPRGSPSRTPAGPGAPTPRPSRPRPRRCPRPRRRAGCRASPRPASSRSHGLLALLRRADRVPHLEPRVPERIQQRRRRGAPPRRRPSRRAG